VPNPQELETFVRSQLNWSELAEPPHAEMFEWYRRLIHLRRDHRSGQDEQGRSKTAVNVDVKAGSLRFAHGDLLCVFNFAAAPRRVRMPRGVWDLALRSDMKAAQMADEMPGQTAFIYTRRR